MSAVPFTKYESTGNDFIVIDNRKGIISQALQSNRALWARACHRRYGIGADGVLFLHKKPKFNFEMIYLNADGAQVEMCGNGARALAHFAASLKLNRGKNSMQFFSSGVEYQVKLNQGPKKTWPSIAFPRPNSVDAISLKSFGYSGPHLYLNTGVPHTVFVLATLAELKNLDIVKAALPIRHSMLFPRGTNVNFMAIEGPKIHLRTFERGVEDETYSCGTGAVAAACFYRMLLATVSRVTLMTKGGPLLVTFSREIPWLSGPTRAVFKGMLSLTQLSE
ncbi:MAG: diaminopimelate epimerase [Bdellovibrionales bacterium GWA2_49_15]|nr:MAG: diaminopimelate epimerase [Bdellovibrionales bacterium GWA2_49_15]HAZ11634.1 diaminopimelate epimerase [Bdellovibrionales bacterium]